MTSKDTGKHIKSLQIIAGHFKADQNIPGHTTSKQNMSIQNNSNHTCKSKRSQMEQKTTLSEQDQKIVAVAIAIQKEGQATIEEIKKKVDQIIKKEKLNFSMTEKQVIRICKKLQKKNLISTNFIIDDTGLRTLAYSPSNPLFRRGIEGMQFMDIVDSEGGEFIKSLDLKKSANKGRLPDIRDYYTTEVTWKVTDEVGCLGFIPVTKESYLEHYRNDKGEVILMPKHFRAYIRENQRTINKSNLHHYMRFDYGQVTLNGTKLKKTQHFVLDGHQGRGEVTHEVIPKGALIKTTFGVPSKGGLTSQEFKKFLSDIASHPIRGLGGASSQGFGRLELVDFRIMGQ